MIEMREDSRGWSFICSDCQVQMIQIDFRLSLTIADQRDSVRTTIEHTCKLTVDGNEHTLDPEQTTSVAPVLPLLNAFVSNVTMTRSGKLTVNFVSGAVFEVEPSDQCEAWDVGCLIDGVGHLFVCEPGGEVSFFKGHKDDPRGTPT